jgi:hypothetical protein
MRGVLVGTDAVGLEVLNPFFNITLELILLSLLGFGGVLCRLAPQHNFVESRAEGFLFHIS